MLRLKPLSSCARAFDLELRRSGCLAHCSTTKYMQGVVSVLILQLLPLNNVNQCHVSACLLKFVQMQRDTSHHPTAPGRLLLQDTAGAAGDVLGLVADLQLPVSSDMTGDAQGEMLQEQQYSIFSQSFCDFISCACDSVLFPST